MLNRVLFYISLFILVFVNLSFNWPLKKPSVTSTYGESRWDHFHDGMDLVSHNRKVFPLESGRLIFQWNKNLFPQDNYSGAGNFKVLRHSGEIYTIYMHLDDNLVPGTIVTPELPIGIVGDTGHSFSSHLHFTIVEMKEKSSVNPLLKLPPLSDGKNPVIGDLFLEINEKLVQLRNRSKIRLTKHYPLLVRISDSLTGRERLGLYRLKAVHNGKEVLDITFDRIVRSSGKMEIAGHEYGDLYNRKGYYKIKGISYLQGRNDFLVTASDFYGNRTEKKFTLNIKLDM